MHRRGVGGWRLARACALTVAALFLSCAAHVLGDGRGPSFLAVVGLGAPILVAAFLLVGRRRGPLTIGSALVIGQVFVHESLMLVSMPVARGPAPGGQAMSHSALVTSGAMSAASAPQHPALTLSMVVWHALATAAIAAGLAFGERAVWHLVQRVLPPSQQVVRLDAPVVLSPVQDVGHPAVLRKPWLRSVSLRGPPLAVAANSS